MSKPLWQGKEVAAATRGKLLTDFSATGVSIDSRTMKEGDLFIALKGERFDAHDYLADVLANGAAGAIVHRHAEGVKEDAPLVIVGDTQKALEALGQAARARSKARIVAITGSVGKTSTKEMVRTILENQGATHATQGNLNNHIGLPLTMSRMPVGSKYGVFELGMNHAGELSALTKQLKPDVALITTVEAVHLEFFDSVAGIARAKAEIFEGVTKGGTAVLPADNEHYELLKQIAVKCGIENMVTFGASEGADFRLVSYKATREGSEVTATANGKEIKYQTGMLGRHQAINSLGALAATVAAGADLAKAAASLKKAQPAKGRGRLQQVIIGGKRVTLLDDSYNASPASMRAGFAVLTEIAKETGGRPIATLGDMRELGPNAIELHLGLKGDIVERGLKQVFTAGPMMKYLHDVLPAEIKAGHADEPLGLIPMLEAGVKENDVLLVKSSNGSLMWKLAEALMVNKVEA